MLYFLYSWIFERQLIVLTRRFCCQSYILVVKKSLLWLGASQWRIYYHRMWGQLSTTRSNLLKPPMGNSQLQSITPSYRQRRQRPQIQLTGRTSHPRGQYPLRASCIGKSVLPRPGIDLATAACEATTMPMRPLRAWSKEYRKMDSVLRSVEEEERDEFTGGHFFKKLIGFMTCITITRTIQQPHS